MKRVKISCLFLNCLLVSLPCLGSESRSEWKYTYKVAAPGKRCEQVYGKLFYAGKELPEQYADVITPIGEFGFLALGPMFEGEPVSWVPCGKLPGYGGAMSCARTQKDLSFLLSGTNPDFRTSATNETLSPISKRPYLPGLFEARPKGVGKNWFYVVEKKIWVNPCMIDDVLEAKFVVNHWSYEYATSRSIHGRLLYKGKELPKECEHVVTNLGEFVYVGHPALDSNVPIEWLPFGITYNYPGVTEQAASSEHDVRCFLQGQPVSFRKTLIDKQPDIISKEPCIPESFQRRPKDAGANWFYLVRKQLWINPEKMQDALNSKIR